MHREAKLSLLINIIGGIAVLGSYVHGISTHPKMVGAVWGDVPMSLRPLYTISMFTAALGYFPFTYYFFFRVPSNATWLNGRLGYRGITALYATMLLCSALWMPMTFAMIASPGKLMWWGICLVLGLTGLASLGFIVALLTLKPRADGWAHRLALLGCVAFCFQTALLDAIVWTSYFPT